MGCIVSTLCPSRAHGPGRARAACLKPKFSAAIRFGEPGHTGPLPVPGLCPDRCRTGRAVPGSGGPIDTSITGV